MSGLKLDFMFLFELRLQNFNFNHSIGFAELEALSLKVFSFVGWFFGAPCFSF